MRRQTLNDGRSGEVRGNNKSKAEGKAEVTSTLVGRVPVLASVSGTDASDWRSGSILRNGSSGPAQIVFAVESYIYGRAPVY